MAVTRIRALTPILFLGIATLAPNSWAQCRVLDPELQDAYAGPCVNGLAEGAGYAKGRAEYQGEFHAGMKHGRGVKSWPNGDRYEGEFVADRKEGHGVYSYGRGPWLGERYEGAWVADRREGQGAYRWPTGDVYSGPWQADRPVGPPTAMMRARARWAAEARAALAKTGEKACREMEIGIGERDWVRGTVLDSETNQVAVRIDDAGRTPHLLAGQELKVGMVVREPPTAWVPCF